MTHFSSHIAGQFKKLCRDISANSMAFAITLLVAIFLITQPIKKSIATDVSIIFWLLGAIVLASGKVKVRLLKPYRKTIFSGFAFFFVALLSLCMSDYAEDLKQIEPEFRFMLLPLTITAIYFSGLRTHQLVIALLLGGISYAWIAYDQSGGFISIRRASGDENAVGFGNGAFLLAAISTYLCLSFWKSSKYFSIAASIATILYLYASIASGTRGSLLALPVIFIFSIIHFRSLKVIIASLLIGAILSVVIYQTPMKSGVDRAINNVVRYVQGTSHNMSSTGLRLKQWEAATCMAGKNPVFGVGAHQFRPATQDADLGCDFNSTNSKHHFVQAHSLYFNTLATMGLSGLTCLLLFGVFLYRESLNVRPDYPHKYAVAIIILTIAGYSLTVDAFFIRFIAEKHLTLLGVMLGIMLHEQKTAVVRP